MLFNSYEFLLFLALVVIGFRATLNLVSDIPRKLLLISASLAFYAWWRWDYVFILLASIAFNFAFGRQIATARARNRPAKALLAGGIAANLALLGWFKYAAFGASIVKDVAGLSIAVPALALPLAISFFTFQQISYLADAARGRVTSFGAIDYLLFVTFFPQLIAGPIIHHNEMVPQLKRRPFKSHLCANCAIGLTIFVIGLFKKTVIADNIAPLSDAVFYAADHGQHISFLQAWCGSLAFTFQIYFDFSGYSDMAVGLARLFGIRLPLNFFSPYKATSIIDFWRRWHITLSRFLRDYLYIPLGGSRKGPARRHVNLLATMLLGGLWHGAGWTFVLWGGLHGLYLVVNHGWRRARGGMYPGRPTEGFEALAGMMLTFAAVVAAWTFFRAESLDGALTMLRAMAGLGPLAADQQPQTVLPMYRLQWMALGAAVVWLAPNCAQLMRKYRPVLDATGVMQRQGASVAMNRYWRRPALAWRPTDLWLAVSAVLVVAGYLYMAESSFTPFLYFNF